MKKRIKNHIMNLLKDESGQGTTEYILILVAVVAVGLIFGPKIKEIVGNLGGDLSTKIGEFMGTI